MISIINDLKFHSIFGSSSNGPVEPNCDVDFVNDTVLQF